MPHQRTPKSVYLHIRMTPSEKLALIEASSPFGEFSEVIREVLRAWAEGRATIVPPPNMKASLYVPRNQD